MKFFLLSIFLLSPFFVFSQDDEDLFDELDNLTIKGNQEVIATFKSTRVMLGQSIERVKNNQLHFRISHVFGKIKNFDNLFGLDNINNMNMSFEYGLTDYIQLGLSRSNKPDKTYSTSLKLSLLRQEQDNINRLFSLTIYSSLDIKTREYFPEERNNYFAGRLEYVNQVLISRKLSKKISLLIAPTWVHKNLTEAIKDPNNIYSIGLGGRYLISESTSINAEYYPALNTFDSYDSNKNTFTIGLDVETGGHVFQLYFTNAFALHPGKFAINQSGDFFKGDINFGFSILREFSLNK